ncbi:MULTISPECIES: DNA-binding protein [Burkholderia]|uniref:helix-turn-helix domain-containing transcriptional regulator n=1 Tax=Burkholderia TaxID=32008 RepID=UPI0027E4FCD2|nr:hypothetical protein [Burkholderia sp. MSMB175]
MGIKTTPVDVTEYLDTPEAQAEYLQASFETGDSADIHEATCTMARAWYDADRGRRGERARKPLQSA